MASRSRRVRERELIGGGPTAAEEREGEKREDIAGRVSVGEARYWVRTANLWAISQLTPYLTGVLCSSLLLGRLRKQADWLGDYVNGEGLGPEGGAVSILAYYPPPILIWRYRNPITARAGGTLRSAAAQGINRHRLLMWKRRYRKRGGGG
ncbi:hypothetical protein GGS23DRAFT_575248 [Durotheca rogersii]|uniref:uncharacterized protein n=1 Tax=Durotheca rogersii TaxID=419775 RepID=UPI002221079D|nr:uncharacterized protein GGS23DRAFT_575248 [Durotheca rogersii]KAI5861859.1 hypothetical protein GGS23DRAFT_575248 [Durotheca rogersii]